MKNLLFGGLAVIAVTAAASTMINPRNAQAAAPANGDVCSPASLVMMPGGKCDPAAKAAKAEKKQAKVQTMAAVEGTNPVKSEKKDCGACPGKDGKAKDAAQTISL